jgi:hypothetical protein
MDIMDITPDRNYLPPHGVPIATPLFLITASSAPAELGDVLINKIKETTANG